MQGFRTRVANPGWLSNTSFTRQAKKLREEVDKFLHDVGELEVIIGHSIGGLEAVGLFGAYPDIKKVIAIESPFSNGTPWRVVEFGARSMIRILEPMQTAILKGIIRKGRPFADRITTVTTVHDKLVPPSFAAFPGAKNIIAEEVLSNRKERKIFRTHTALPNSPLIREEILLPELLSLQELKATA